jgi:hypothetical protein
MKRIALIAPFDDYKNFSICLEDDEKAQLTPLIYLKKSTFISDEEYKRLVNALQLKLAKDYLPEIISEGELV